PAVIGYTSGASGAPKGVVLTWANLTYQVTATAARQRIPAGAVFVSILPAYHMFELIAGCLTPLYLGASVHYPGSLLPRDILTTVATQRATDMVVVPLFLAALRRNLDAELARMRAAGTARRIAAALPFPLRRLALAPLHARLGGRLRRLFVGGAPLD